MHILMISHSFFTKARKSNDRVITVNANDTFFPSNIDIWFHILSYTCHFWVDFLQ